MSLKDVVKNAFLAAANVDSALPLSVVYGAVTTGVYDPVTNVTSETVTEFDLDNVFGVGLTQAEVEYFPADRDTQKLLIAGADLPVVPKVSDRVTIGGVRWEVKRVKRVPGDALFIVFIQEP